MTIIMSRRRVEREGRRVVFMRKRTYRKKAASALVSSRVLEDDYITIYYLSAKDCCNSILF